MYYKPHQPTSGVKLVSNSPTVIISIQPFFLIDPIKVAAGEQNKSINRSLSVLGGINIICSLGLSAFYLSVSIVHKIYGSNAVFSKLLSRQECRF